MWWFKKRRRSGAIGGAWDKLCQSINKRQRAWADYLQQQTKRYSHRTLVIGLCLFCGVYACAVLYGVAGSLKKGSKPICITPIMVPLHVNSAKNSKDDISPPVVARIRAFKYYLDSLKQTPAGKQQYDSLIAVRPGLLDSLNTTLSLFSHQ